MKLSTIRYISKRFSNSKENGKFLNFARTIALISVMLGSMALIISLSVLDGFQSKLEENILKFTSHINITSFNRKELDLKDSVAKKLKSEIGSIKSVDPILQREGLIRSDALIEGIVIKGISESYSFSKIKNNIVSGDFSFTSAKADEISVGKRLARRLNAKLGDTVVVYAIREAPDGSFTYPDVKKLRIKSIYETGLAMYDDVVIFMPYSTAAKMMQIPEGKVTNYEISLENTDEIQQKAKYIEALLEYPYYTSTVYDLHSPVFAWIELQKAPIPIVLGLISIVAVMNIITILLITVVEKTRSIGILRSLGINRRSLLLIFVSQGVSVGAIGTFLGCLIALIFGLLQQSYGIITLPGDVYFLDTLPVEIRFWHYAVVISVSIFLSFISTLIPSYIATKINPIKAIRFS
jgi:lipoprotein-releasing system permease protein